MTPAIVRDGPIPSVLAMPGPVWAWTLRPLGADPVTPPSHRLQHRVPIPPPMDHPRQRPPDRPPASLVARGVEEGYDVALGEDTVVSDEHIQHRQDLSADTTCALTRANADPEARQAHQSRFRLGYRHLHERYVNQTAGQVATATSQSGSRLSPPRRRAPTGPHSLPATRGDGRP